MSIDELGRGLVNESRKVRRRQRKRQERYAQRAALAQIALPIGARIIEDGLMQKAQDFFQSEEVLNLKRQQDRAIRHQAETYAVEEAIAASGGDGWGFFHDQVRPIVEESIAAKTSDKQEGLTLDGARRLNPEWERLVAEETKKLTGERFEAHQKALTAAEKVVSSEEFDAELARQLKPTTPTSIVDSVGRRISTLFGGTSTEERQQVALNSIRNHYFATDAKALAEFNEEYRSTGNVRNAVDWAELVTNTSLADYEPVSVSNRDRTIFQPYTDADGNQTLVPITIKQEVFDTGRLGEQQIDVGSSILTQNISEDEHQLRVNRISTQFNLIEHPNRMLTQDGLTAWHEHLRTDENLKRENGDQILPNTVRTVKEYNAVLDNFNTWLNENEDYLKPDAITVAIRQGGVEAWMRSTDFLEKSDNLDRTNYWSLSETEEYRLAERYYYESLTPEGTTVTKPDGYDDKYLPAIIAGEEFHGTFAALSEGDDLDGKINKMRREEGTTSELEDQEELEGGSQEPVPVATLDWPDSYKELQERLAELKGQTGRNARDSRIRIQHKIDNFVRDRTREIARLSRAGNVNPRGRRTVGPSAEDLERIAELEEELEQYLAMQNQDSTTPFETIAGAGA